MEVWVVTGGVACGKSAVTERLVAALTPFAVRFSSDEAVHQLLAEGSIQSALVQAFGANVMAESGRVDRVWLRENVLPQADLRRRLEAILHPGVFSALDVMVTQCREGGRTKVLVAEVPLFYETGALPAADKVIVVGTSQETQIERMRLHRGLTRDVAVALIEAQMAVAEKVKLSDRVIWNDGIIDSLENQVRLVSKDLRT